MIPRLSGHFSIFGLVWFGFLYAQVSSGNCATTELWKICNFDPEAFSAFQGYALRKFEGVQHAESVKTRVPIKITARSCLQANVRCQRPQDTARTQPWYHICLAYRGLGFDYSLTLWWTIILMCSYSFVTMTQQMILFIILMWKWLVADSLSEVRIFLAVPIIIIVLRFIKD